MTRRDFAVAAAAAATPVKAAGAKLAILGGEPVRKGSWPSWPKMDKLEEDELLAVLRSGHWGRTTGKRVEHFEAAYARLTGTKYCVATANGTSALIAALNAIGVGPGDEVLLPPYTFVATLNVILLQHALPVFVDTDIETSQIDHRKIEATAGPNTVAVIPVHLGGSAANLDAILPLAKKKGWRVVEDACQSHLGEWRGRKVGSLGDMGCFSFQASKNLNSGEGGAIISDNEELTDRAYAFHANGRSRKVAQAGFSYASSGANLRLTEFQAVLLEAQMTRLEEQSKRREQNAAYLTQMLKEIPGIAPAKMYDGCTRNAWHLYMLRYDKEAFGGLPRRTFLQALGKEGVPGSGGYTPLNKEPFLLQIASSPQWKRIFGEARLKQWLERNQTPMNDRLCEQAVWFTQTMLLGTRQDMEMIAEAIRKIHSQAAALRASASSAG
jgi:dTDP-4-amino-4,6-dideoxygalactose transaminase